MEKHNHSIQLEDDHNLLEGKVIDIKRSYNGYELVLKIDKLSDNVFAKLSEYIVHTSNIKIEDTITICIKYKSLIVFA